MLAAHTATVETLTAEVRVQPKHATSYFVYVVGCHAHDGSLARSWMERDWPADKEFAEHRKRAEQWSALSLIVLAGLR